MLGCSVIELDKTINNWKCIDQRMLYDLLDFCCPSKGNGQHINFLINYVNGICNNKISLPNDKFNGSDIDYIILKTHIGYFRNKFIFYDHSLSSSTKNLLIETKYKHVLMKFAIFKASENVLIQDIYNIIFNILLL